MTASLVFPAATYSYRQHSNLVLALQLLSFGIWLVWYGVTHFGFLLGFLYVCFSIPIIALGTDRLLCYACARIQIVDNRLKCYGGSGELYIDCPMSDVFVIDTVRWRTTQTWRVRILDGPSFEYNDHLWGHKQLTGRLNAAVAATSRRLHS